MWLSHQLENVDELLLANDRITRRMLSGLSATRCEYVVLLSVGEKREENETKQNNKRNATNKKNQSISIIYVVKENEVTTEWKWEMRNENKSQNTFNVSDVCVLRTVMRLYP